MTTRREFLEMLAASAALPLAGRVPDFRAPGPPRPLRIRAITAGVELSSPTDRRRLEAAIAMLGRARKVFESDGYEVQTLRVAAPPLMAAADDRARDTALPRLQALD